MKQIIPFKKELLFKTKVSEITSISLEHRIISKNKDLVSGSFIISGDYKMTEGSINREIFNYDIPFEINLESNYDVDSVTIDIDNFYYEIVNNEVLKVNIDVYLIGDKCEKDVVIDKHSSDNIDSIDNIDDIDISDEVRGDDNDINNVDINYDNIKSIDYDKVAKIDDIDNSNINDNINNNSIFDSVDSKDTYVTYYVYIVREEDTLDKILEKFNVTREELEKYNDINNIHEKDKLIIPNSINE